MATIGMTVEIASDSKPTSVIVRTSPSVSARRSGRHRLSVWSLVAGRSIRQGWRRYGAAARCKRSIEGLSPVAVPQRRPQPRDGRGMKSRMRGQGPVQPEQRRAQHGECLGTPDSGIRRGGLDAAHDPLVERRVPRLEHASRQDDRRGKPGHVEADDDRPGHRDQLVRLPVEDRARDRIPGSGRREDDR